MATPPGEGDQKAGGQTPPASEVGEQNSRDAGWLHPGRRAAAEGAASPARAGSLDRREQSLPRVGIRPAARTANRAETRWLTCSSPRRHDGERGDQDHCSADCLGPQSFQARRARCRLVTQTSCRGRRWQCLQAIRLIGRSSTRAMLERHLRAERFRDRRTSRASDRRSVESRGNGRARMRASEA